MEPTTTEKELFKTDSSVIAIDENNIITIRYFDDVNITLEDFKKIIDHINTIASEYEDCTLLTVGGQYTMIDNDARELGNAHNFPVLAEAFVLKSLAQRIFVNFLMRLRKKRYPVKAIDDEKSAKEWLLEIKKMVASKRTA